MDKVTIVVIDRGSTRPPDIYAFNNPERADAFAAVVESVIDIAVVEPLNDADADRLIATLILERREDERAREAGL